MAGKPPDHVKWKPGQSGNPSGRPKGILTSDQVRALIGRFWGMTREQLHVVVQDQKSSMGEIMVASIMAKCAKDGDYTRLDGLLNRTIGKVKEQVEVTSKPSLRLLNPDGSIRAECVQVPAKELTP